jgi:hypothetical protein
VRAFVRAFVRAVHIKVSNPNSFLKNTEKSKKIQKISFLLANIEKALLYCVGFKIIPLSHATQDTGI